MSRIVGAISMSHAPGVLGWPDAPSAETKRKIHEAHAACARRLNEWRPDLIVAFLDDHFENHFRTLMPTFSVGIAPSHSGPADYMMAALRFDKKAHIKSSPELGELLLRELVHHGFDVARMGEIEYGNNLMVPLQVIRPQFDIPVLPLYINVFSPPLPTMARTYDFGAAVAEILENAPGEQRIAFLATGGLSHWPPVWLENAPESDQFLQRMRRYQTLGKQAVVDDPDLYSDLAKYEMQMAARMEWPLKSKHPLINADWDREVLKLLEQGDAQALRSMTFEQIEQGGGHGGHELLNWIAAMGAMGGAPATVIAYEPVKEWICGMGYISYEGAERRTAAARQ
jgi:2,3-dihydroxyphenylpropionate 1,2-dioxygenase